MDNPLPCINCIVLPICCSVSSLYKDIDRYDPYKFITKLEERCPIILTYILNNCGEELDDLLNLSEEEIELLRFFQW